jgi:hypothetical protein
MKTWKRYTCVGFLTIMTIAFVFVACDDGTNGIKELANDQTAYYGAWYCAELFNGSTVTINSNTFKIIAPDGDWWQIVSCTWEAVTNSHVGSKNAYPVGYKLIGTESGQNWTMEGNYIWIYLHINKKNLIVRTQEDDGPWVADEPPYSLQVFVKQQ